MRDISAPPRSAGRSRCCVPAAGPRVVGNRSAEGAPPSGSWRRNGWAQPGHRAAPGNETPGPGDSCRYPSPYFVSATGSSASR
ncbi:hypothetical protein EEJ42_47965 [Streptomyces botrytidirepellens]|uniref:Uncharacterized protein n=1 Tax=Streptomyces botrytidirepellens TaxID=2486417 RepID=A0A3M8SD73_9ACTN|nr:hypothetical protein EEJ42_47965 [Streptomyces botrytidirepellens]